MNLNLDFIDYGKHTESVLEQGIEDSF